MKTQRQVRKYPMFSDFLQKGLNEREMTQATLAELMNTGPKMISRWARGETMPRPDATMRLAEVFEVPKTQMMKLREMSLTRKREIRAARQNNVAIARTVLADRRENGTVKAKVKTKVKPKAASKTASQQLSFTLPPTVSADVAKEVVRLPVATEDETSSVSAIAIVAAIAMQKYRRGDTLTDRELSIAIDVLSETEAVLAELGPVFHLAWKELNETVREFNRILKYRQITASQESLVS